MTDVPKWIARRFPKPTPRPKKPRQALQRSWMKRRKSKRVQAKTPEEREFLAWLHTRACAGWYPWHKCDGPIQAAHYRDHTGAGRCEPYKTCIPLCRLLHDEYDGRAPSRHFPEEWTLDDKKTWHLGRQLETQAAWESFHERAA